MEKKKIAQKMIQHTHYDRKTGKLVRTMVPESKEHKEMVKSFPKRKAISMKEQMGRTKENKEFQAKHGRAWND